MSFDSKTESVEKILLVAQRTAFNKRDFNLVKLLSVVTKRLHEPLLIYTDHQAYQNTIKVLIVPIDITFKIQIYLSQQHHLFDYIYIQTQTIFYGII